MLLLNLLLIVVLLFIFFQDFKEQRVYWFLFPIVGFLFGLIHYRMVGKINFFIAITSNLVLIFSVLFVLFLYSKLKLKMNFMNGSFGLGDIFFFIAIGFSFPTLNFIVLFVFSIFFSLAIFLFSKEKYNFRTVPLAGLMSLFFAIILCVSILFNFPSLYLVQL